MGPKQIQHYILREDLIQCAAVVDAAIKMSIEKDAIEHKSYIELYSNLLLPIWATHISANKASKAIFHNLLKI